MGEKRPNQQHQRSNSSSNNLARHPAFMRIIQQESADDLSDPQGELFLEQNEQLHLRRHSFSSSYSSTSTSEPINGGGNKRLFSEEFAHEFDQLSIQDSPPNRKKQKQKEEEETDEDFETTAIPTREEYYGDTDESESIFTTTATPKIRRVVPNVKLPSLLRQTFQSSKPPVTPRISPTQEPTNIPEDLSKALVLYVSPSELLAATKDQVNETTDDEEEKEEEIQSNAAQNIDDMVVD